MLGKNLKKCRTTSSGGADKVLAIIKKTHHTAPNWEHCQSHLLELLILFLVARDVGRHRCIWEMDM